ncbi:fused MFS/spermidine synthase [Stieleria sp. TO1_6]|uniref:fused MFS/spermidine synthase n=1 Tax=Stieleria tagensis TaxID=2956795 RepID=UPI00209BB3E9|nr:fused MFS/spermidine synthase [Stieleria tagensis]MCO8120767.1 fused MFS/spermidine synthase [Stieleria tagensis]
MSTQERAATEPANLWALPLLLASGCASLVYQVVWVKQLSLVVGVDVHAVTTAVSAFFAGLAIGSYYFGRRADRLMRPLRLYALVEIGIAVFGIATTLLLSHAAPWFVWLETHFGFIAWALPFVLVGLPAVLMGGTVPIIMRVLAPDDQRVAGTGGRLYAANTCGAIGGALLAPFGLIPLFGVRGAGFTAAAINVLVAVVAFAIARRSDASQSRESIVQPTADVDRNGFALALYFLVGGLALGYEVIWSQSIVQWTSTRSFAFAVVLATYLFGLVLGSAWFARRGRRPSDPWGEFGLLIVGVGLAALLGMIFTGDWLSSLQIQVATWVFNATQSESLSMASRFATAAGWIVLVPTFLLGAAFPAILRLTVKAESAGRDTGLVLAFNTVGGIVGTALTGFVLVPSLGLERSLALISAVAAMVGIAAVTKGASTTRWMRWATYVAGGLVILLGITLRADHLAQLLATARNGELVFCESSASGTVAIIQQKSGVNRFRRLYIQGVSNSGDSMTSLRYMRLQALLPLMIHRGQPRDALVIGLGTGITTGSLLRYPGLKHRVCAELLPAVIEGASRFEGNYNVTTDPRVEIRLRDGRRELLRSDDRYDLITLEPPPPSAAGVVNLYSRDFYQLSAKRLNPSGLVAQWLPLPTQTDLDTRSLVRSFLDVFPHANLWTTELHEMLLVGSLDPIEIDADTIAERFNQPEVAETLGEVGIASPAALLATWVTDRAGLERYAADALPTTDDRPRIEYGDWVMPGQFIPTLQALNELYTPPPLSVPDPELQIAIAEERDRLLAFYEAGIYAYHGDRLRWNQTITWLLEKDPRNPYYRWFVQGTGTKSL